MKYKKAWGALLILALLSPLGLIAAGGAWGEWKVGTIRERVGFVPAGMRESVSHGGEKPLKDYTVPGLERGSWRERIGVIAAAFIGAGVTALAAHALVRVARHDGIS